MDPLLNSGVRAESADQISSATSTIRWAEKLLYNWSNCSETPALNMGVAEE
jgi:hypothetical protein